MRRVAGIAFKEWAPPGKLFMSVDQIVDGYGLKPLFGQLLAAMGTDIPGPAGHQYVHRILSTLISLIEFQEMLSTDYTDFRRFYSAKWLNR